MLSTEINRTPLFQAITKKGHNSLSPIAKSFDVNLLNKEISKIEGVAPLSERDTNLAVVALVISNQLRELRNNGIHKLKEGLSKRSFIRMGLATANFEFASLQYLQKLSRKPQRDSDRGIHLAELNNQSIKGAPQENMTADDIIDTIIDTLPHWFYEGTNLTDERENLDTPYGSRCVQLGRALSIERGYRDIWQSALWEGHRLSLVGSHYSIGPKSKSDSYYWFAWYQRFIASVAGPARAFIEEDARDSQSEDYDIEEVVVSSYTEGGRYKYRIGTVPAKLRSIIYSNFRMIENTYLGGFLDEPFNPTEASVNLRTLLKAKYVLGSVVNCMNSSIKRKRIDTYTDVKNYSYGIKKVDLIRIIARTLKLDNSSAGSVISWLTISPTDTARCFNDGLWLRPLVELDEEELLLLAPSILAASPIRFMEGFLSQLSKTGNNLLDKQGRLFEADIRRKTISSVQENPILNDCYVFPHALSRNSEDEEEIDIIVRLGKLLIVGEVKCFVSPSEPMERFNFLRKVEEAADQALKKATWLRSHTEVLDGRILWDRDYDELEIIPMVILNQLYGSGLQIGDVIITDASIWDLFFSAGSYSSGVVIHGDKKMFLQQEFYNSFDQAVKRFREIFKNPPPLQPFLGAEEWRTTHFPLSNGQDLFIAVPGIKKDSLVSDRFKSAQSFLASLS